MKNEKEYLKLDTFSVLSNIGWALTLLRMVGVISTDWNNIIDYWLALFGIALTMGVMAALIGLLVHKGGNNSAQ